MVSDASVVKLFASLNHFLICCFRVFKHIICTSKRYEKLSFESELHVGLFTVLINLCKPVNSLQTLNDFEGSKNRTHSLPSLCHFYISRLRSHAHETDDGSMFRFLLERYSAFFYVKLHYFSCPDNGYGVY